MDLGKVPKKLAGGPVPDLEEAFDVRVLFLSSSPFFAEMGARQVEDEVPESDDENKKGDDDGISGDKLLSTSKPGKKAKTTTTTTSKQPRGKVKPKR